MQKFMTSKDVAERYGITQHTVLALIRSGEIPAYQIGNGYKVKPEDLEEWEKSKFVKARKEE